jgi:protein arginine kinase activator
LSINNLLAGLFNVNANLQHTKQDHGFKEGELLQCDHCGMTLPQFLKVGKFGCSRCYEVFEDQLNPLLKRLHGGNWKHGGKIPQRSGGTFHLRKKIDILKETLQTLIKREEFEKAAEIRDEIRTYEKLLQEGGK